MDDAEYFERRAQEELALAQRSSNPAVVRAHFLLAGLYLDRLHSHESGRLGADVPPAAAAAVPAAG
jgi:hypothetical protein